MKECPNCGSENMLCNDEEIGLYVCEDCDFEEIVDWFTDAVEYSFSDYEPEEIE